MQISDTFTNRLNSHAATPTKPVATELLYAYSYSMMLSWCHDNDIIAIQLVAWYNNSYYYNALLEALPPVCMKYTVWDESRLANIARGLHIAWGKASCYIRLMLYLSQDSHQELSYPETAAILVILGYFKWISL